MTALLQTLGGIGLFLFGMAVMTSGLRKLAGERLRAWLARSTRNPVTGALTGATVTALVQSSSATTVAAIGFVGAGLMTFTASLGIIFGANIGTTVTGWMVALFGFKIPLEEAALALLFVAAFCYLFKQVRRLRGFGKALAGFCLIFIGISYLKEGLHEYRDVIDLSQWNAGSMGGRFVLLLIGILLTLVTQSSSATVATALTALNASILDLPQAAAVIIGADIGTTATAALATLGGSTASRRTGFAHVIYNLMTGVAAFFFLPLYLYLVERFWPGAAAGSPEMVAVGFHSTFNTLGVILALPFTRPFGRLIERIFPEKRPALAAVFDPKLLDDPHAAFAGLCHGSTQVAEASLRRAGRDLEPAGKGKRGGPSIEAILGAVETGRDFAVRVGGGGAEDADLDSGRIFACIHLLDHVERLSERGRDTKQVEVLRSNPEVRKQLQRVADLLRRLEEEIGSAESRDGAGSELAVVAEEMEDDRRRFRQGLIQSATRDGLSGEELDALLDAHRWLRRVAYHAARIGYYGERVQGIEE